MWQRAEHELGAAQRGVLSCDKRHVSAGDARGGAALFVRRCEGERERR